MGELRAVMGAYPHTRSLLDKPIELADGDVLVAKEFAAAGGPAAAAARMLRAVAGFDYDVAELPVVNYLSAKEHGVGLTAIPVFSTRRFVHNTFFANVDQGVQNFADLAGKRVGIPYYGHTDSTWARGILAHEYGVDIDSITWVTSAEEQVAQAVVPANVVHIPRIVLGQMLRDGEIAAQVVVHTAAENAPYIKSLIDDPESACEAWHARTGIFPILHTVVVKDEILATRPNLARELFQLFSTAKQSELDRVENGAERSEQEVVLSRESGFPEGPVATTRRAYLGVDPLPYGLEPNRANLETLISYSREQRVIDFSPSVDDLFAAID